MLERQMKAVDERLVGLRQKLAQPLSGVTLIRAVRWFDAPVARLQGPSDVWLFDGRIGAVTAPDALKAVPDQGWTAAAAPCCRACGTCTPTCGPARA
jgi:hypothetical protein